MEEVEGETEGPVGASWHEREVGEVDGPCLEEEEEEHQSPDGKVEGEEEQMLELWKEEGEAVLLVHGQGVEEEEVQSYEVGVGEEDLHVMEEVVVLKQKRIKQISLGNYLILLFISATSIQQRIYMLS